MTIGKMIGRGLIFGSLLAASTAFAQVEDQQMKRDEVTEYVYHAMAAQKPGEAITDILAHYIDDELTGYRVTYADGSSIEFEPDGHVLGRNPDTDQHYK